MTCQIVLNLALYFLNHLKCHQIILISCFFLHPVYLNVFSCCFHDVWRDIWCWLFCFKLKFLLLCTNKVILIWFISCVWHLFNFLYLILFLFDLFMMSFFMVFCFKFYFLSYKALYNATFYNKIKIIIITRVELSLYFSGLIIITSFTIIFLVLLTALYPYPGFWKLFTSGKQPGGNSKNRIIRIFNKCLHAK